MTADAFLRNRATYWLVVMLAATLFAITNLPWHLDDYDQAKQAFTSFEMVEQGHWFYQHTPNGWVATKPPLVGWISAGLFAVTRSWEVAWRIPSVIATVGLILLTTRIARNAFGEIAALLAASALVLNLFVPRLATLVRTDMPLALIIFATGSQIWAKLRSAEPWTARDRGIAFALLTAAMLIKGPIVYAFLLPGVVLFEFLRRRSAMRGMAWCGWAPWLGSLGVFVVWVVIGVYFVPEFFEHVVIREFGGRFEGTHRAQPLYFYLPHLLHKWAPWSLLLIFVGVVGARAGKPPRAVSTDTLWLLCWAGGGIAVMSLVPSKRVDRIFPVVPPLCLLLAAQFSALKENRRAALAAVIALFVGSVFAASYSIGKMSAAFREHRNAFSEFGRAVRAEVARRDLRFALIGGEDEGMLLYLRKTEFIEPPNAIADWRSGAINAIVAPVTDGADLAEKLPGGALSPIVSGGAGNHGNRYVLIVRR